MEKNRHGRHDGDVMRITRSGCPPSVPMRLGGILAHCCTSHHQNSTALLQGEGLAYMADDRAETGSHDSLERLELPGMTHWSLFTKLGPGTVPTMTGIGMSHLVSAPTARALRYR